MKVSAGLILTTILSGIILGTGSVVFENAEAVSRLEERGISLKEMYKLIEKRFDRLEAKIDGNRINN